MADKEPVEEQEQEEFSIPHDRISFDKAIEKLHELSPEAFETFQRVFIRSLSVKQLKANKKYTDKKLNDKS